MILDLILIGLAITLEPVPITAFILVLSARKGLRAGLAFVLAWLACLVGVMAAVLLSTGGSPPALHSTPSTASIAVKLTIGVGLIVFGEYRRRRAGRPHRDPAWLAKLNDVSPWTAAGLAVLLQPWALVAAGAATVVQAKVSSFESYLALVLFCLLSSASLLAMELHVAFSPESAGVRLARLRTWLTNHQDQAIVVLSLLLGLWLVGRSIAQLVQ
ncbi:GAP family protein [Kitasatospora sp. NBC_01266]|uniref:GAP family protein n=1 Tax=Kitasatospora sp. NBC_01266 TaxID=2903572 RepID=UPI002E37E2A2|nr:GAP family protein [Kitasatospora sp. NBC_01266]